MRRGVLQHKNESIILQVPGDKTLLNFKAEPLFQVKVIIKV
jgi:hypothetical protein